MRKAASPTDGCAYRRGSSLVPSEEDLVSSCCSSFCSANERKFGDAVARRDLARYRSKGLDNTTRLLRDAILEAGNGRTVLDVGGGIGALSFELLAAGAERVTVVEASPAYMTAARDEARRRNVVDRLELVSGDFVSVAETVGQADVVALDRVVCCYPAYRHLLEAAVSRSRRLLAVSYPRDRWYVRAAVGIQNATRALLRNPFRGFVHPARAMEAVLAQHGFVCTRRRETLKWSADLYVRADAA
jgi:cyclopropane fatty-acyl-phospholipid synthase-like methyltransferase